MVVQGGGRLMVSAPFSARSTRHPWVGAHSCQMHRIPDARPREASSVPFGCPATAERLRTLEAVVERTRALGVEVRCELEAHRDHASKASES